MHNRQPALIPESGIRSRQTATRGGLCFIIKSLLIIRYLCVPCQTLVFYGSDTCVLRLKHLCLTAETLVSVTAKDCICQTG